MENIHEKVDALIDQIYNGNHVEAEETFNALMQEKVNAFLDVAKQEVASSMFNTQDCVECEEQNEEVEVANEALKGNQHKIDANKNGKIDAQDFKMLRKNKMKEAYADPYAAKKAAEMKKKKEEAMAAAKKEYDASQESKGKVNTKNFMKMKEEVETVEENKYSLPAGSTMKPGVVYKKQKSALEKRFGHLKPGESASLKGNPKKVTKKTNEEVEIEEGNRENKIKKNKFVIRHGSKVMNPALQKLNPSDEYAKITGRDALKRPEEYGFKKEEVEIEEASYSAKMARAGKDIGKPGKMFAKIVKKASRKYGKARGEKIAGAVLAKMRKKGK